MSEYAVLYAVLVGIYLVDCVVWLPSAVHPFRGKRSGPWEAAAPLFSLRGGQWTAFLAGVVPGRAGVVKSEAQPIPLSPMGLCVCGTDRREPPIPLERLAQVKADDEALKLGNRTIGRVATSRFAAAMVEWLRVLAAEPPERRAERIEAGLHRLLDTRVARRALRRYRWCVRPLAWRVWLLALAMYVVFPIAVLRLGLLASWPAALLVVALLVAVLLEFRARRVRLGFGLQVPGDVVMMVLAPPMALRADDLAGRDLMGGLHALAVARVAGHEDEAKALAAGALRRLHFPMTGERESCCDAASWSRTAWRRVLERWIAAEYGSAVDLHAAPARESERSRVYCPRCIQQFETDGGECPDCGIGLIRFA